MFDYCVSPSVLCLLLPADKYIITESSVGDTIFKYLKLKQSFPLWQNVRKETWYLNLEPKDALQIKKTI